MKPVIHSKSFLVCSKKQPSYLEDCLGFIGYMIEDLQYATLSPPLAFQSVNQTFVYDEVYQVELIKELSARVYGRLLNMILEAGYDKTDMSIFECLLLQQFKEHKRSNLFDESD